MYRFNLNNVSNLNLKTVEEYLNKNVTQPFLEHLAEKSFEKDFYEHHSILIEEIECSILHFDVFLKNKVITQKILSLEDEEDILEILLISIKEEISKRFKRKLENILNKLDKRLNKDLDLIDKKTKI